MSKPAHNQLKQEKSAGSQSTMPGRILSQYTIGANEKVEIGNGIALTKIYNDNKKFKKTDFMRNNLQCTKLGKIENNFS